MAPVMAGIGMGASLLGGIVGAQGAEYSGAAQAQMYRYRAGVAQTNARIALQDANYARMVGEVQAGQAGLKARSEMGQTRAAFGAGNIGGATVGRVIQSQTDVAMQDQGIIRANAAKKAYGFEVKSKADMAESTLDTMGAEYATTAADFEAESSILAGVAGASSKFMQYKSTFG